MITPAINRFYELLANQPAQRLPCGSCGHPRWVHAHLPPVDRRNESCACGECPRYKKGEGER